MDELQKEGFGVLTDIDVQSMQAIANPKLRDIANQVQAKLKKVVENL